MLILFIFLRVAILGTGISFPVRDLITFDASGPEQLRVVAWITYLNTVTDGGGTHFVYQNHTVEARKGKTVLFPPGYTHLHHGVVSPTQEKYIVTGWFAWNMK